MADILKSEYSEKFDELRQNRVEVSFFKYGPAKKNFGAGSFSKLPTTAKVRELSERLSIWKERSDNG